MYNSKYNYTGYSSSHWTSWLDCSRWDGQTIMCSLWPAWQMNIQMKLSWASLVTQGWLNIDITRSNKDYTLTGTEGITMPLLALPQDTDKIFNKSTLLLSNSLWGVPKPNWTPDSQSREVLSLKAFYAALETEVQEIPNLWFTHLIPALSGSTEIEGNIRSSRSTSCPFYQPVKSHHRHRDFFFFLILFLTEVPQGVGWDILGRNPWLWGWGCPGMGCSEQLWLPNPRTVE